MSKTKTKKTASDKLILTVKPRVVFGKKLKKLRRENQLIGNVFGQEFKSQAVTVDFKDFIKVYRTSKETGVVYLELDKKEIPVLIQHLQKHPVSDKILHIDFRKVDLSKKIETEVPIKIIGSSKAVSQKSGVLLTQTNNLKIEARPEDLPSHIEIDISVLKEINQEIKVADLPKKTTYTINELPEKVIVSVVAHKEEAVVPETATATPEIITEKAEGEAAGEEAAKTEETAKTGKKEPEKPPPGKPTPSPNAKK